MDGTDPAVRVGMRIGEIMNTDVVATSPRASADRAWSDMRLHNLRHLVVMERKQVVGILSERDLGGRNGAAIRKGRTVGDLMTRQVVTAEPSTTIRQAANLMRGRTIGCLPVLEDGEVVGIVPTTDILDELGRGSTRPTVRAERRVRRAPASHHRLGGAERTRVPSGVSGRAVSSAKGTRRAVKRG